jgi:hypothetical protein
VLGPTTGEILWQTADRQTETLPGPGTVGARDLAAVWVADGVVWAYNAGSSASSGPSIVDGAVSSGSNHRKSTRP